MPSILSLEHLNPARFETAPILKKLASASRQLAELKGVAASIPNQGIFINTLGLQEAKDSSAIENIVTTHDELFRDDLQTQVPGNAAAKEVLEENRAGFRKLPGTALKDGGGKTVYTPPQNSGEVLRLMGELERFINGDAVFDADPLIKMSLIHHQFESIHPFYDGNGRTGRIVNVLYLVKERLLDIPVLYLSSHIVRTKGDYYRLLQTVRDQDAWEDWVVYMLEAVERTAAQTIDTIHSIKAALFDYKHRIRAARRFYSQDLINNLFTHPYTKIEFIERDLKVSRLTATKYLEALTADGFLLKRKIGRSNFYINIALNAVLISQW